MTIHKVYRDGKLHDEIDADTRHVTQIVSSYAHSDEDHKYTVHDEKGELYYEIEVRTKKSWKVHNGPFTTGGKFERDYRKDKQ